MPRLREKTFAKNEVTSWSYPNYWDFIALTLVIGIIVMLGWTAKEMTVSYQVGEVIPISLDPSFLPYYAARTVLRMLIALVCSLLFTFVVGALAAKSKRAGKIIIPAIDILQSVPVLGFLSIAVVPFMALFPGSLLGPECAAIFAIFTSQVWNMTLSFYQSCRTVPPELKEAVAMFQLSSWQSFWRLDVPFAMPGLIWNCMMSMSASWFFVVASEAITSFNPNITLPGIGSYIGAALPQANLHAVFYAIIAMFFVILIYDQLLFRPLSQWIERFTFEEDDDAERPESWIVNLFARTRLMQYLGSKINRLWDKFVTLPWFKVHYAEKVAEQPSSTKLWLGRILHTIVIFIATALLFWLAWIVFDNIPWREGLHVAYLGCITGIRVMLLIFLSSLVWVPIGVWIGLRPALSQVAQPIIQFLAAFPANLFYPVMVVLITTYDLNADIWTSPLIILGTQWYILFNVIVGTIALPKTYKYVAKNFHLKGWLWWKRLILPGIFPYYVTGAITAAGGAWNASVVAECLHWGAKKVQATGLGNYIANSYETGDSHRLALGIVIMCIFVVTINRFLWRPLYNMAERRFVIGE